MRTHRRRLWPAWAVVFAWVVTVFAATGPVPADKFLRISDDQGLAHSDVRAVVQDQEGFIWLGLRLGGLTRFDGYQLKVHQHDPSDPSTIGSRVIWSLLVDRGGTLWVGTEGGLDRYDRKTESFTHYRHDDARHDSLANNVVVCLFEDSAGQLWAGTRNGLSRLDDRERGTFTTFTRPQVVEGSNAKDAFRSIMQDPVTGLLWLGTSDGVAAFDPRTGAFASFLHDPNDPQSVSRNAVNKVIRDSSGTFWALTEFGLNSFQPKFERIAQHSVQQPRLVFRRYGQPAGEVNPAINFIRDGLFDHADRMWLATRGGLQLFDRNTGGFTTYRRRAYDATSISDDFTHAVCEDRAGNLWIGTYAGGANVLRAGLKPFRVHRPDPLNPRSLGDERISGLAFDSAGRLWASTMDGLNRHDPDGWTRLLHDPANPDSAPSGDLGALAATSGGEVWIGTLYNGVYRYDGERFRSFPTSPSNIPSPNGWHDFTGGQINSILPDAQGGVWLGARDYGVDYYSGGRFRHYTRQDAAPGVGAQPTTNALFGFTAADGRIWFVSEVNGLVCFDPRTQRFTNFLPPIEHAGATRNLHCLAEGGDGSIWLGAADGLLKFDPRAERFVREFSTADGLPHAAVVSIVRDRRDHLWLGTANGLADFDPATERFRCYDKADGLPANVFSQRCGVLGPDGRVYLGTRAGIVDFAPEELHDNPTPPPVVLTELRWLGPPPADERGRFPASVFHFGETIRVPAGQLGFRLSFSALDFTAPEKNRYRHRLEGWETEWSPSSTTERSVTYTALPPGAYTFRVQASNSDLVWNERGTSVRILVAPHFWQTFWFRAALVLLGASLVVVVLNWRLRSVRRRNALLEDQVSQRTAQLEREVAVRQQAEAELRESHAELEDRVQARTAELAQSNANLLAESAERRNVESQLRQSQKMEAVGQLAGGVAHDFNNLLTVIIGQSELLSMPGGSAAEREAAVRDIKAAANRAANLTRQLLVFSRQQAMNPVVIDLNDVVTSVSKLLGHVIGERITLETRLEPGPLGTRADPGMLEQVLLNMAVNARDAMPRGGCLTIATVRVTVTAADLSRQPNAKPGDYVRFSVTDTGEGIPDEVMAKIFEPFFTTKAVGKGTGLGLAISFGIMQQHGGWIEVKSQVGQGSTFHGYLPSQSIPAAASVAASVAPATAADRTTLLLVEDDAAVRKLTRLLLARRGYQVIEACSGAEALTLWPGCRDQVTILLTDIVMPGWPDGNGLAAQLLSEKPSLRVATMSGYDPTDSAGRDSTRRPHVRKPFTEEELIRAIDATRPT